MKVIKITILLVVSVLLTTNVAIAEIKTFMKEYTYVAGELDSKVTSRFNALEQAKRLLLEELGVFLTSHTEVTGSQLIKDQISTITAGIVSAVIMDESWDGTQYWLKVKIEADPSVVQQAIKVIRNDKQKSDELELARMRIKKLIKEIEEIKSNPTTTPEVKRQRYDDIVKNKSATDWFIRALITDKAESLIALNKAIEIQPKYVDALNYRSILTMEDNPKNALEDINKAIKYFEPNYTYEFVKGIADLYILRADLLYANRKYTGIIDALIISIKYAPEASSQYINFWAKDKINTIIKYNPKDSSAYILKAITDNEPFNKDKSLYTKALATLKKATVSKNDKYLTDLVSAMIYRNIIMQGNTSEATQKIYLKHLTNVINSNANSDTKLYALERRAAFYFDHGKPYLSVDDYKKTTELKPLASYVYENLAEAYYKANDKYRAVSTFEKALEASDKTNTRDYLILNNIGDIYFEMGVLDKARDTYSKAIDEFERYTSQMKLVFDKFELPKVVVSEMYRKRGSIYKILRQKNKALADYAKAIEIWSANVQAIDEQEAIAGSARESENWK